MEIVEIEVSHTLVGVGEGHVQGRGKWRVCGCYSDVGYTMIQMIHQYHDSRHTGGFVPITLSPVCICEEGVWGRGDKTGGLRTSHTLGCVGNWNT